MVPNEEFRVLVKSAIKDLNVDSLGRLINYIRERKFTDFEKAYINNLDTKDKTDFQKLIITYLNELINLYDQVKQNPNVDIVSNQVRDAQSNILKHCSESVEPLESCSDIAILIWAAGIHQLFSGINSTEYVVSLYKRAAELNSVYAKMRLAEIYTHGNAQDCFDTSYASRLYFEVITSTDADLSTKKKACDFIKKLALKGVNEAQVISGQIYLLGINNSLDHETLAYFREIMLSYPRLNNFNMAFKILMEDRKHFYLSFLSEQEIHFFLLRIESYSSKELELINDVIQREWDTEMYSIRSLVTLLQSRFPDSENIKTLVNKVNQRFEKFIQEIIKDEKSDWKKISMFRDSLHRGEVTQDQKKYILSLLPRNFNSDIEKSNLLCLQGIVLRHIGKKEMANTVFGEAIGLNPNNSSALYQQARIGIERHVKASGECKRYKVTDAAKELLEKAAILENPEAKTMLADMSHGELKLADSDAVQVYETAMKSGAEIARVRRGHMHYSHGPEGKGDPAAAIKLYKQAVGSGNLEAMSELAYMYDMEVVILRFGRKDYSVAMKTAIALYEKLIDYSDYKNTQAMLRCANLYSSEKNNPSYMQSATELYYLVSLSRNIADSVRLSTQDKLSELATEGIPAAIFYLGVLFLYTEYGFEVAFESFKKSDFTKLNLLTPEIIFKILIENNKQPISLLSEDEINVLLIKIRNFSPEDLKIILDMIEEKWDIEMYSIRSIINLLQLRHPDSVNTKTLENKVNECFEKFIQEIIKDEKSGFKKTSMFKDSLYRKEVTKEQEKYILDLSFEGKSDVEQSNLWCLQGIIFLRKNEYGKAIQAFDQAISLNPNNLNAVFYRAYMHEHGLGGSGDLKIAFELYERAAGKPGAEAENSDIVVGNPDAHVGILNIYKKVGYAPFLDVANVHFLRVPEHRVDVYKAAIRLGSSAAMVALAQEQGDDYCAVESCQKAIARGNTDAMLFLAKMYQDGGNRAIPKKNEVAAKQLYYRAGTAEALLEAADMECKGIGGVVDKGKAAFIYYQIFKDDTVEDKLRAFAVEKIKDLAYEGTIAATHYLVEIYLFGAKGFIEPDFAKAVEFIRKPSGNLKTATVFKILIENNKQPISILSEEEINFFLQYIIVLGDQKDLKSILDMIESEWDTEMYSIRSVVALLQSKYSSNKDCRTLANKVNECFEKFIQEIIKDEKSDFKKISMFKESLYRNEVTKEQQQGILDLSFEGKSAVEQSNLLCLQGIVFQYQREFNKAIVAFDEAIRLNPNNSNALNYRADLYVHTLSQDKKENIESAISLYKKAIELNNPEAWVGLFRVSRDHELVPYLEQKGLSKYAACEKAANAGSAAAIGQLARLNDGQYSEVTQICKQAIALGDTYAMLFLANMHRAGRTTNHTVDMDVAIKLYERARRLGNSLATYELACICDGDKRDINPVLARAVDLGRAGSLFLEVLQHSSANDELKKLALQRLQKLASNEGTPGNFQLGIVYILGIEGFIKPDFGWAVRYIRKSGLGLNHYLSKIRFKALIENSKQPLSLLSKEEIDISVNAIARTDKESLEDIVKIIEHEWETAMFPILSIVRLLQLQYSDSFNAKALIEKIDVYFQLFIQKIIKDLNEDTFKQLLASLDRGEIAEEQQKYIMSLSSDDLDNSFEESNLYCLRGAVLLHNDQYNDAGEAYDYALRSNPKNLSAKLGVVSVKSMIAKYLFIEAGNYRDLEGAAHTYYKALTHEHASIEIRNSSLSKLDELAGSKVKGANFYLGLVGLFGVNHFINPDFEKALGFFRKSNFIQSSLLNPKTAFKILLENRKQKKSLLSKKEIDAILNAIENSKESDFSQVIDMIQKEWEDNTASLEGVIFYLEFILTLQSLNSDDKKRIHLFLGTLYFKSNKPDLSTKHLQEAQERSQLSLQGAVSAGFLEENLERFGAFIQGIIRSLNDENFKQFLVSLHKREVTEAQQQYILNLSHENLEGNFEKSNLDCLRGAVLAYQEKYDDALAAYNHALSLNNKNSPAKLGVDPIRSANAKILFDRAKAEKDKSRAAELYYEALTEQYAERVIKVNSLNKLQEFGAAGIKEANFYLGLSLLFGVNDFVKPNPVQALGFFRKSDFIQSPLFNLKIAFKLLLENDKQKELLLPEKEIDAILNKVKATTEKDFSEVIKMIEIEWTNGKIPTYKTLFYLGFILSLESLNDSDKKLAHKVLSTIYFIKGMQHLSEWYAQQSKSKDENTPENPSSSKSSLDTQYLHTDLLVLTQKVRESKYSGVLGISGWWTGTSKNETQCVLDIFILKFEAYKAVTGSESSVEREVIAHCLEDDRKLLSDLMRHLFPKSKAPQVLQDLSSGIDEILQRTKGNVREFSLETDMVPRLGAEEEFLRDKYVLDSRNSDGDNDDENNEVRSKGKGPLN